MKKSKLIFLLVTISFFVNLSAQSFSVSKIYSFLTNQNANIIKQELKIQSFKFVSSDREYGMQTYQYSKTGSYGREEFMFGKNDELFSISYRPTQTFYKSLKQKMLTSEFLYAYSYGDNKYYESNDMRIGVNDKSGIMSFFVVLK